MVVREVVKMRMDTVMSVINLEPIDNLLDLTEASYDRFMSIRSETHKNMDKQIAWEIWICQ
jgi:hypothetical protein